MEDLSPSLSSHPWHIRHICSSILSHGTKQCSATCHRHPPHLCRTVTQFGNSPNDRPVLQVRVPVHMAFLSWNNALITLMSYSKTLRILGKISSLFSILKIPHTLSLIWTLLLLPHQNDWCRWRQISTSWSIPWSETVSACQAPLWKRNWWYVSITLPIHSMIADTWNL